MRWEKVSEVQDPEAFFEDYVREALASEPAPLPPHRQQLGPVLAKWHETTPGIARIAVEGGTVDDRWLAEVIVREQLRGHGFKQAAYELDWDLGDTKLIKEATWDDIMAKAKRLIQSGNVQLLRNGYNIVVGQVQGDHGTYQTEFSRDDPNSQAITTWQCDCPWDQFAWQRTRKWKKYEGRVCSHLLATFWLSRSTPLDEDVHPANQQGGQPGQMSLFNLPPTAIPPGGSVPRGGPMPPSTGPQLPIPGMNPQMAQGTAPGVPGQAPPPPEIIPPYPMSPEQMPLVNPASVPGQKQPSPLNPIQWPGGTFSSWHFAEDFDTLTVMAAQEFVNGQLVSPKYEDVGTAVGRSEAHGAGQQMTIPQMSVGEVLGTDPTTGMVNVYYTGPCAGNGPMEPHGVVAWHWPSDLTIRTDVRPPGPAVRRRR